MQNLKEIYYSSNLDPIPNPDLLFLSADGAAAVALNGPPCELFNQSRFHLGEEGEEIWLQHEDEHYEHEHMSNDKSRGESEGMICVFPPPPSGGVHVVVSFQQCFIVVSAPRKRSHSWQRRGKLN